MSLSMAPSLLYYADSGGNINILVTSTKESEVGAVRHAFQSVFGKATVTGVVSINPFLINHFTTWPCIVVSASGISQRLVPVCDSVDNCWPDGEYWPLLAGL